MTMAHETIQVQNLKCGGCAKTIETRLSNIPGVSKISIDIETSRISFLVDSANTKENILEVLHVLGYPEVGNSNSLVSKATSYISCAIGKISQ